MTAEYQATKAEGGEALAAVELAYGRMSAPNNYTRGGRTVPASRSAAVA